MTNKLRLTIEEDDGTHVMSVYVQPGGVDFEGADLSGLSAIGVTNLKGKCFRRAVLYWANLACSDFTSSDFQEADLRGAVLRDTTFTDANLHGALLGIDNLGGPTQIQGANFASAELDGADFRGAQYDKRTIFPSGFDPTKAGCAYIDAT